MTDVAVVVLAVVFCAAGYLKLKQRLAFRIVLRQLVPSAAVPTLAVGIPASEFAIGLLLVSGVAPRAAGIASLVLLGLFTSALVFMYRSGATLDCGCFGEAREASTPASGIVRNVLLLGLAASIVAEPAGASLWTGSVDDGLAALTIAAGLICLWLLSSVAVVQRSILRPILFVR